MRGARLAGASRLAGALAAVAAVLLSAPASAYVCTRSSSVGPSLGWERRDVELRPHDDDGAEVTLPEIAAALAFAAGQWTSVDCSDFAFVVGPATDESRVGFDWRAGSSSPANQNIVVFRNDDPSDPTDAWLHPVGAGAIIALTTVTFIRSTGVIVDADVEMNDVSFRFTACEPDEPGCAIEHDLKNTLTHELGHVLGLDHPPSSQPGAVEATMFASASAGDVDKRDLASDDIAGLCALYPAGQENGECYGVGRGEPPALLVRDVGCASTPAAPPALAFLLLLGMTRCARWRSGRHS